MLRRGLLGWGCVYVLACSTDRPDFAETVNRAEVDSDATVGSDTLTNGTTTVTTTTLGSSTALLGQTTVEQDISGNVMSNPVNPPVAPDATFSNTTNPATTDLGVSPNTSASDVSVNPAPKIDCTEPDVRACWEKEDGTPLPGDPTTMGACVIGEQSCTAEGKWGRCVGAIPAGVKRCDERQPQICDSDGSWQNSGDPCQYVCNSSTGACEGSCLPGAKQCNGLQPQLCDSAGSWQNSGSACSFSCSAMSGTCTGSCVPGSKSCSGSQPQVCDADGAWQNSGAACGDCTICGAATGSCVTDTGAACDDGNACTTGETCQASGACGGGSAKSCGGADECHTVGACVPASGCPLPVVTAGAPCDDGNACTLDEVCQANGTCDGGSARTCEGADQCHAVGACLPASGCPAPVVMSGNCDDGNECTLSDSCQSSGVCQGTMAPNTASCDDNMFCDGQGACKCRTQSSWNLLANPGFDGSATSWEMYRSSYSTVDVDSCSGSGSVLIPGQGSISQCMPASPNQTYYVGYQFKSANDGGSGTAHCYVAFLPAGNTCASGQATITFDADVDYSDDVWVQGFAGGASDSDTTHLLFACSMVFDDGYYDQLALSTTLPTAPGF